MATRRRPVERAERPAPRHERSPSLTEPLPSVSVVVTTYNRRALLPRVVEPLLADPATTELIVVVDGCDDGSLQLLEELAIRDRRLRPVFVENRGRSRARQAGVELAEGEVILLVDDDVVASTGLVSGHARHHARAEDLVVVGYMPVETPPRRSPGDFATYLYADSYDRFCAWYESDPGRVLLQLWGGNVSLRKANCLRVPLHSERFAQSFHEDQDFGIRCLRAGLRGTFDRSLLAHHVYRRDLDGFVRDAREEGAGRALVRRLHADVLGGPLERSEFEAETRPVARSLVRLCRRPQTHHIVCGLLGAAVRLAGRVHLLGFETRLARLLQRLEQQHGAQKALAAQGRPPAGGPQHVSQLASRARNPGG